MKKGPQLPIKPLKALRDRWRVQFQVSPPAFIKPPWIHLNADFNSDQIKTSLFSFFFIINDSFLLLNAPNPPCLPFIYVPLSLPVSITSQILETVRIYLSSYLSSNPQPFPFLLLQSTFNHYHSTKEALNLQVILKKNLYPRVTFRIKIRYRY